ncbi:MAG: ABC transporter permease [Ilumatobacter sp.]|uniref:ABC transporter permease n=1 Tax=Ilumatobacter sp. TaxID=1967498 RepID=UPI00262F1347|nr:ABC transporter permease [Ilumatobacter sp.]MDJ0771482.1 ABC transporter permease [Ilumatobacter sp.]
MFLALREMARAKVRFGLLIVAIGMLVFLILFQQSLQNGLLTSFVGAIRNQSAPVLVYSVDGQRVVQGSIITPDLEALAAGTDGVGRVGRVMQGTFTAATEDGDRFDTSVIGVESPDLGAPSELVDGRFPSSAGEAVGSDADADQGFGIGDVVVLEPGGFEITIVGLARDVQLNAGPTLFTDLDDYVTAVQAVNPDAGTPLPNVLAIVPAEGVDADALAERINARSDDLDALTRAAAADETPGVSQIRSSFAIIFLLYGLVIPCVTGLFFLIVTFQKSGALTLLRALGAPARRLVASLLIQAVLIVAAGFVVGVALYTPVSQQRVGGLPLRFETGAVVLWAALLLLLGIGSSLVAARRVLAIDPMEATTGGGAR